MSREEDLYSALIQLESGPESEIKTEFDEGQNPTRSTPLSRKNTFIHHDAHPLLLDLLLLNEFGIDWIAWEAETLWSEIQRVFKQPPLPIHSKNKIQAVRTAHVVDTPWEDWEVFEVVTQALNNNIPNFQIQHRPSSAQIMNSVHILSKIRDVAFLDEVEKYIAACFLDEGIYFLPPPVDFAQKEAAMLKYRCSRCGNVDRDDDNDQCDSCGAPESDLEKAPTFDFEPVRNRYMEIVAQGDDRDELEETIEDVQVAKLLVARDYVDMRDQQLAAQIREVEQ